MTTVTCPACKSEQVEIIGLITDVLLEGCRSCAAFWEAETRECPVTEPCDNCAWRPGSPERADSQKWAQLMKDFKRGSAFYCHKRVPAELGPSGYDFQHTVAKQEERMVCTNANLCAGWIAWKIAQTHRNGREKAK